MDDCFFPGSDDELGFEEVELEDDTVYGNSIIEYSYYSTYFCSTLVKVKVMVMATTPVLTTATLMRVNLVM